MASSGEDELLEGMPPREAFSMSMQALAAASAALERRREDDGRESEVGRCPPGADIESACRLMARSCTALARRGRDRRGRPLASQSDEGGDVLTGTSGKPRRGTGIGDGDEVCLSVCLRSCLLVGWLVGHENDRLKLRLKSRRGGSVHFPR